MVWVAFTIYILSCLIDGVSDGFFFHAKKKTVVFPVNVHIPFTIRRVLWNTTLCLLLMCYAQENLYLPLLAAMLMFSFLHNGSYYYTRNKLNPEVYPSGWFDQSTTSTAFWTDIMVPEFRVISFVLGVAIYFVWAI